MKSFFIALLLCLIFAYTSDAQSRWAGKVVQVIDGRTVVVAYGASKITVLLKDIEVPETEQPLANTVKDHLSKLLLNKNVVVAEFSTYSKGVTGTVFIGDIDISQQLLRDGAAWFNYPESLNSRFASEYQKTENISKLEKRGVWGVVGLKPAWEFRAEKQKEQVEKDRLAAKQAKPQLVQTATETIWADVQPSQGNYTRRYSLTNEDKNKSEIKENLNPKELDRFLTIAVTASDLASDFERVMNTSKKNYDYYLINESLNAIDNGLREVIYSLKNPTSLGLASENKEIVEDAEQLLRVLKNHDNAIYSGDFITLSRKYNVFPTVSISGEKVIFKQDLLKNMFGRMRNNFDQLRLKIAKN